MLRILTVMPTDTFPNKWYAVFKENANFQIICSAARKDEILWRLPHTQLVLLDVSLGQSTIRSITRFVVEKDPHLPVLVMGVEFSAEKLLSYIESGASGYILKNDSLSLAQKKIVAASRGEMLISPEMASLLIKRIRKLSQLHRRNRLSMSVKRDRLGELSRREKEVLVLISQGYSNNRIAQELYIEYGTVKNHVHRILKKLEVSSRYQAINIYRNVNETAVRYAIA